MCLGSLLGTLLQLCQVCCAKCDGTIVWSCLCVCLCAIVTRLFRKSMASRCLFCYSQSFRNFALQNPSYQICCVRGLGGFNLIALAGTVWLWEKYFLSFWWLVIFSHQVEFCEFPNAPPKKYAHGMAAQVLFEGFWLLRGLEGSLMGPIETIFLGGFSCAQVINRRDGIRSKAYLKIFWTGTWWLFALAYSSHWYANNLI